MHPDIARKAFERLGELQQPAHFFFAFLPFGEQRLHFARHLERHELAGLERNQLGDAVAEHVRKIEHAPDVAYDRFGRHRAERRDLRHRVRAILLLHVIDDAVPSVLAEVDVEVRHRYALRIEEALEQQRVAQRIEIRDAKRIGDERSGAGAAARAHGNAVALCPINEVGDDQEVAGVAHLNDGPGLEVEPLRVFGAPALADSGIGVKQLQSLCESCRGFGAEMVVERDAFGGRKGGQIILPQRQREVATLCDLHRVGERLGKIGKRRRHLRLRLEILVGREPFRPARIGEHMTFGDAHTRLVGTETVRPQELDRMRRDHRQGLFVGERDRRRHERIVVGVTGALRFEVIASRKSCRPFARGPLPAAAIALQQRMADVAVARARQCDQPVRSIIEPLTPDFRAPAIRVGAISASEPVGELQIAGARGHEQQRAKRLVALGLVREPEVAAEERLDARAARGAVELDQAEHVGEIADRQCRHGIGHGRLNRLVDAQSAVDDREFAVEAQVDECGRGHGGAARNARILPRSSRVHCLVCPRQHLRTRVRLSSRPRRPRFWPGARRRVSLHAPVRPQVHQAREPSISRVFRCPTGKATRMDARAQPAPSARTRRASPRTATIARAGRTDSRYAARNDAFPTRR